MQKSSRSPLFSKDFLWGASTSAHQVEGGTHNQWSVWELENARALATQAEYQQAWMPSWELFKSQAMDPENYVSGRSTGHFQRYTEDFDLLVKLGFNSFRFSIEWSRIQPSGPKDWNHEAVQHYREYLQALRERNIEPVVTLWHFTHPVWFEKRGGFTKYNNLSFFVAFAERVMRELGQSVRYIITINEPDTYTHNSFRQAIWPPQKTSWLVALDTYHNMLVAHKLVYRKLKKQRRNYQISFAKTYAYTYPADEALTTKLTVWWHRFLRDRFVLLWVRRQLDFIAVNYYFADRIRGFKMDHLNKRQSDLGWNMEPIQVKEVLLWLHKTYKKPILITENGLADANDSQRRWWLEETLKGLLEARKGGVKLLGYLHWSLIDNFEWSYGKWPRFGLVAVNYDTLKRTIRPSARWFAGVLKKLRGL